MIVFALAGMVATTAPAFSDTGVQAAMVKAFGGAAV